jgi:hypothetical protein
MKYNYLILTILLFGVLNRQICNNENPLHYKYIEEHNYDPEFETAELSRYEKDIDMNIVNPGTISSVETTNYVEKINKPGALVVLTLAEQAMKQFILKAMVYVGCVKILCHLIYVKIVSPNANNPKGLRLVIIQFYKTNDCDEDAIYTNLGKAFGPTGRRNKKIRKFNK